MEHALDSIAGRAGYGEGEQRMSWPSAALASWAIQLQDMIATGAVGEHTPPDCPKCRAVRIYWDLLELKRLCENQERKELAEAKGDRDKYMEYAGKCADACEKMEDERDEMRRALEDIKELLTKTKGGKS